MSEGITIEEDFFTEHEALFERLRSEVDWDHSMSARLTASFGVPYNYGQMVYPEAPMHAALLNLSTQLQRHFGFEFNNCLLNYYVDERSKMGFHSDDITNLRPGTGVAIVSLGEARTISFRQRDDQNERLSYLLRPGSLLFMELAVQQKWAHAIKRRRGAGGRISLTWRAFQRAP